MKNCILVIVLMLFSENIFSQTDKLGGDFIFKLNYSQVNSRQFVGNYSDPNHSLLEQFYDKNAQFNAEGLFQLNRILSSGIYMGYSGGTYISNEFVFANENQIVYRLDELGKSFYYGLKAEMHILPLILHVDRLRLDVYLPLQAGLVSQRIASVKSGSFRWDSPAFEAGGGLGFRFDFTKNFGIYSEYMIGQYFNQRNSQWKTGLVICL